MLLYPQRLLTSVVLMRCTNTLCLSVCLSVRRSVCPSIHLSVCVSICLSTRVKCLSDEHGWKGNNYLPGCQDNERTTVFRHSTAFAQHTRHRSSLHFPLLARVSNSWTDIMNPLLLGVQPRFKNWGYPSSFAPSVPSSLPSFSFPGAHPLNPV